MVKQLFLNVLYKRWMAFDVKETYTIKQ